jgi:hypothetical protein
MIKFLLAECPLSKGELFLMIRDKYPLLTKENRLRKALQRVNASPGGENFVFWTSLREVSARVVYNNFFLTDVFAL